MKITPETKEDIATLIAAEFRSFGGGRRAANNPIAAALEDRPAAFALGVEVQAVVDRVIELFEALNKEQS